MIGCSGAAIVVRNEELGADEVDVLFGIEEAIRRAVQRDEAVPALDVLHQSGFIFRG
jgi:hypothetical protein